MDRVLMLGESGKLGRALREAFEGDFEIHGRSTAGGFDAGDFAQVRAALTVIRPRFVINAVAHNGLEICEQDPERALRLNALLPRFLAECSARMGFRLIHFSSDAVFDGLRTSGAYRESDVPNPINTYGLTKYGGDCFIRAEARDYYIFRLSILAGDSARNPQFLERMILRARAGATLQVAQDIVCSPSYVRDIAAAVRRILESDQPSGLYHLANAGTVSLYDFVREVVDGLGLKVPVEAVPHTRFPGKARKNTFTPLASESLEPLRDWRAAMAEYCARLRGN